jgi:hypothetical protein
VDDIFRRRRDMSPKRILAAALAATGTVERVRGTIAEAQTSLMTIHRSAQTHGP